MDKTLVVVESPAKAKTIRMPSESSGCMYAMAVVLRITPSATIATPSFCEKSF